MSDTNVSGNRIDTSDAFASGATLADGIFGMFMAGAQAKALRSDARAVEAAGIAEANDRARAGREAVATGAAIAGASGFTTEHSATDVLARMAAEAETSAGRARWEANREADRLRYEAKVRKRGALFGLFSSVIKSAAIVAGG